MSLKGLFLQGMEVDLINHFFLPIAWKNQSFETFGLVALSN